MSIHPLILYTKLLRLDRPIGIFLLLWPSLWALWIAGAGKPTWKITMVFVIGTVLMRSAGCAFNDYADRDIDPHVTRTRDRPLANRSVKPTTALYLAAALSLMSFLLVLTLHPLTWLLSLPALFLAVSYPFTKRFFALPQAYLGIAFGFGIPMAFAAIQHTVPTIAWWLLAANVLWAIAYDTEYAIADRADDIKIGIKTAAITFGRYDIAAIIGCQLGFISLMLMIGYTVQLGYYYLLGVSGALLLIGYQYWMIRDRDPQRCLAAFKQNNWVGGVIWLGILADYQLG